MGLTPLTTPPKFHKENKADLIKNIIDKETFIVRIIQCRYTRSLVEQVEKILSLVIRQFYVNSAINQTKYHMITTFLRSIEDWNSNISFPEKV